MSLRIDQLEVGKVYQIVYDDTNQKAFLHKRPDNGSEWFDTVLSGFEFIVIEGPNPHGDHTSVNIMGTSTEKIGWFVFFSKYIQNTLVFEEVETD